MRLPSMNIKLFLTIFSIFLVSGLIGQHDKIAFEKFGVQEGLPEEFVIDILQDDQGYIWCGTQNGLIRYDGYSFKIFKASENLNDSTNIQFNQHHGGLLKGRDGKIWAGSGISSAIASFDPLTESFRNYYTLQDKNKRMEFGACMLLKEDVHGNIWYRYYEDFSSPPVTCRLDPVTGNVSFYPYSMGFIYQKWGSIAEKSGKIWILNQEHNLLKYNHEADSFKMAISASQGQNAIFLQDTLRTIAEGNGNRLLLTGDKGLYLFDADLEKITKSYTNDEMNKVVVSPSMYNYTLEDKTGVYWILQLGGNVTRINARTEDITTLSYGQGPLEFNNRPGKAFLLLFTTKDESGMWFQLLHDPQGSQFSFVHYDYHDEQFHIYDSKFNVPSNPHQERSRFYTMIQDQSGLLWLATRPDMYKQAPKKHQFDLYRHDPDDHAGLPSDSIRIIFEDSRQRLWIGTNAGIAIYQPNADNFKVFQHDPKQNNSISHNRIRSIMEDADGNIWIGTQDGLNIFNETSETFSRFSPKEDIDQAIEVIYKDSENNFWVSNLFKGVELINPSNRKVVKSFSSNDSNDGKLISITSIYEDSKGNVWFCDGDDNQSGLFRYQKGQSELVHYLPIPEDSTSIESNEVQFVVEGSDDRLWVGTDNGLSYYNYDTDEFTYLDHPLLISSINYTLDADQNLWIGSYAGGGLIFVEPMTNNFIAYGEEKGLLHNDIVLRNNNVPIAVDDFGNMWLPNQRGLSVFNLNTKAFTNYFEKDGFQPYSRRYAELKTSNGDIWIGGTNGLSRINPAKLLQKDSSKINIVITKMTINDSIYSKPDGVIFQKAVSHSEAISLKHWQKDLQFEFTGLHFLRPEDNLYSWKLENYNDSWSAPVKFSATQPRRATYTNLSPGTYTFKVKGANADGVWNEDYTAIEITIRPPWWRTTLAYAFYLMTFIGAFAIYSHWREQNLTKEKERLEGMVKERTQSLESTLDNLKSTQSQLIQSEKMASLGELTAGIAHEIQNPLNFVNNFSEINTELIDEMKEELKSDNKDEALNIADDIKDNEEKIMHHGKRADAIVKSMLQHSRSGKTEKEETDINELIDEYLRLAYHGLRAKDKSFNAKLETDLDSSIGPVYLVQQDIGRVLLNIITNAFYAVSERKAKETGEYEPTVSIASKRIEMNDGSRAIQIEIKDNGNGIPDAVIDKIFQPFFTTKPTGKGTGLGLSMAYDIIKAHGGDLTATSDEGKGTTFTIILPENPA